MKNVILSLVMVASVNAFAGYTAEICQITEDGAKASCRMVYFDRDLGNNSYQFPGNCSGEAQDTVCENPNAKVPGT